MGGRTLTEAHHRPLLLKLLEAKESVKSNCVTSWQYDQSNDSSQVCVGHQEVLNSLEIGENANLSTNWATRLWSVFQLHANHPHLIEYESLLHREIGSFHTAAHSFCSLIVLAELGQNHELLYSHGFAPLSSTNNPDIGRFHAPKFLQDEAYVKDSIVFVNVKGGNLYVRDDPETINTSKSKRDSDDAKYIVSVSLLNAARCYKNEVRGSQYVADIILTKDSIKTANVELWPPIAGFVNWGPIFIYYEPLLIPESMKTIYPLADIIQDSSGWNRARSFLLPQDADPFNEKWVSTSPLVAVKNPGYVDLQDPIFNNLTASWAKALRLVCLPIAHSDIKRILWPEELDRLTSIEFTIYWNHLQGYTEKGIYYFRNLCEILPPAILGKDLNVFMGEGRITHERSVTRILACINNIQKEPRQAEQLLKLLLRRVPSAALTLKNAKGEHYWPQPLPTISAWEAFKQKEGFSDTGERTGPLNDLCVDLREGRSGCTAFSRDLKEWCHAYGYKCREIYYYILTSKRFPTHLEVVAVREIFLKGIKGLIREKILIWFTNLQASKAKKTVQDDNNANLIAIQAMTNLRELRRLIRLTDEYIASVKWRVDDLLVLSLPEYSTMKSLVSAESNVSLVKKAMIKEIPNLKSSWVEKALNDIAGWFPSSVTGFELEKAYLKQILTKPLEAYEHLLISQPVIDQLITDLYDTIIYPVYCSSSPLHSETIRMSTLVWRQYEMKRTVPLCKELRSELSANSQVYELWTSDGISHVLLRDPSVQKGFPEELLAGLQQRAYPCHPTCSYLTSQKTCTNLLEILASLERTMAVLSDSLENDNGTSEGLRINRLLECYAYHCAQHGLIDLAFRCGQQMLEYARNLRRRELRDVYTAKNVLFALSCRFGAPLDSCLEAFTSLQSYFRSQSIDILADRHEEIYFNPDCWRTLFPISCERPGEIHLGWQVQTPVISLIMVFRLLLELKTIDPGSARTGPNHTNKPRASNRDPQRLGQLCLHICEGAIMATERQRKNSAPSEDVIRPDCGLGWLHILSLRLKIVCCETMRKFGSDLMRMKLLGTLEVVLDKSLDLMYVRDDFYGTVLFKLCRLQLEAEYNNASNFGGAVGGTDFCSSAETEEIDRWIGIVRPLRMWRPQTIFGKVWKSCVLLESCGGPLNRDTLEAMLLLAQLCVHRSYGIDYRPYAEIFGSLFNHNLTVSHMARVSAAHRSLLPIWFSKERMRLLKLAAVHLEKVFVRLANILTNTKLQQVAVTWYTSNLHPATFPLGVEKNHQNVTVLAKSQQDEREGVLQRLYNVTDRLLLVCALRLSLEQEMLVLSRWQSRFGGMKSAQSVQIQLGNSELRAGDGYPPPHLELGPEKQWTAQDLNRQGRKSLPPSHSDPSCYGISRDEFESLRNSFGDFHSRPKRNQRILETCLNWCLADSEDNVRLPSDWFDSYIYYHGILDVSDGVESLDTNKFSMASQEAFNILFHFVLRSHSQNPIAGKWLLHYLSTNKSDLMDDGNHHDNRRKRVDSSETRTGGSESDVYTQYVDPFAHQSDDVPQSSRHVLRVQYPAFLKKPLKMDRCSNNHVGPRDAVSYPIIQIDLGRRRNIDQ